ncbi:hypothetical protein B484DRAFT_451858, partial [Ochromonadaceae sp. CCMP2298]
RARLWVPGVSSPGRPNDYINLFLEETKQWMRSQMTMDAIHAQELSRRDMYYAKLKNDNYYWCFGDSEVHKVIDYVHERVKNALELISREEKNRSLQSFFKELNDHSTNAFEFGKQFLAYLMYPTTKVNGNLTANRLYDGRTYETGRLHSMLEEATNIVLESYVRDMDYTAERTSKDHIPIDDGGFGIGGGSALTAGDEAAGQYLVDIADVEESNIKSVLYVVEICDPKGHRWVVKKSFADFEALHKIVLADSLLKPTLLARIPLPPRLASKMFRDKQEYYDQCTQLQRYFLDLLLLLCELSAATQAQTALFMEVKALIMLPNRALRRAEGIPNVFVALKRDFAAWLVGQGQGQGQAQGERDRGGEKETEKAHLAMAEHRKIWGIEMSLKVFEAYALLQRMATVLGWTLEINHFFISMFGNTLAFSKLPLRDIIFVQKDIMSRFLSLSNELYQYACQINADSKYKWHKNLQMVENELNRVRFHVDRAVALISLIDSEHLDYETQMRRLRDVHARFAPLMSRIDSSLVNIHQELDLPVSSHLQQQQQGLQLQGLQDQPLQLTYQEQHGATLGADAKPSQRPPVSPHASKGLNDTQGAEGAVDGEVRAGAMMGVTVAGRGLETGGAEGTGVGAEAKAVYVVQEPVEDGDVDVTILHSRDAEDRPGDDVEGGCTSESKVCVVS